MSILYPTDNPYSATPLDQAYAWIGNLTIDFMSGNGQIQVVVNSDIVSGYSGKPPIKMVTKQLGDGLPSLAQVLYENSQAFGDIRAYLYHKLLELPEFANGFEIERVHYAQCNLRVRSYVIPIPTRKCNAQANITNKVSLVHSYTTHYGWFTALNSSVLTANAEIV